MRDDWPIAVEFPHGVEPAYERVILVTIDTLRADHVSAYGYARSTTPFFDSLARKGVLFTRANATVSHTAPSHSSMLTGLPPLVHGLQLNGHRMDEDAVDLARVFAAAGFETAACVNTEFLQGVARSFQTVHASSRQGEEVLRLATTWLREERSGPRFFLWAHFYDPHRWKGFALETGTQPLFQGKTPPDFEAYLMHLHGLSEMGTEGLLGQRWEPEAGKVELKSVDQYLRFIDAYDTLIHYADQQLRALFQAVEALGLSGITLWIVTADHGEGLASHGLGGHGGHIYQEQLVVPLLFHASDGSLARRRVDTPTTHLDLFPTLIEVLGGRVVAPPDLLESRSLWPLLRGAPVDWPERALFAQRRPSAESLFSLQTERFKLLDAQTEADELFDLAKDPFELENVLDTEPSAHATLARELERRLQIFAASAQGSDEQEIPEEWLGELRDLGYVR